MISTIITAIVAFISTNIDDIFVLTLLFTNTNDKMKTKDVILGQYLGIALLIILSLLGALGVSVIPKEYIGLIGFIPIVLGIVEFFENKDADTAKNIDENISLEINYSSSKNTNNINQHISCYDEPIKTNNNINIKSFFNKLFNTSILKVAGITIANGGDNIGIYIPLFSTMNLLEIFITIIIFTIFLALLCIGAIKIASHPLLKAKIKKYNHILIPTVFITLGLFILIKSNSLIFLWKKLF